MKNKISCLLFILLFTKFYGQSRDTLVVYDHVVVYDTIKIYDTVFVYDTVSVLDENFFQKNNGPQNAVLAIDTATKQLSLQLFFQNDTATLPINSILLSENTKNSEAMKKEILTLVAAAMVAQSAFAQENKTLVAMNEEKIPAYTINMGANLAATGDGNIIGINLRVNKTIKPKLLLGISSDIGRMSKRGYTTGNSLGNITQTDNLGFCEDLFLTTTYYFLGNSSNSKNGMYGRFGLGVVNYKLKYSYTAVGFDFIDAISVSNLSFSGEMCMGADFKLGKGKFFAELVYTPILLGNNSVTWRTTNSSGTPTSTESYKSQITAKNFEGLLGVRIGYTLNF